MGSEGPPLLPIDGPKLRKGRCHMGKDARNKRELSRLRADTGQHQRIMLVMAVLGILAFLPIAAQLYRLMVVEYDYYAARALRNQTRTTTVTAERGNIYDRNMNILASSVSVENVYLDPHELKQAGEDVEKISAALGEILERDPAWIQEQAKMPGFPALPLPA